nr:class I adenylate-forming enzyme family protein [Kibdelosporangium sp. MJ126-NF4]CEL19860.1 AMP-dependent synthetase and ligase [Kibdelosporangium sp. MJ126-NF4]CTQ97084.1 AMP-dependent synthetase and ligase [Kibdelosporangium sp. MJ126-NF4]
MSWVSSTGLVLRDLVPAGLRRSWVRSGHCQDRELYALFRDQVRDHPRRTAVIDDEGSLDYTRLDNAVTALAARLTAAGCGSTDVIGVREGNTRVAVIAELAVLAIGAVVLPVPPGEQRLVERARASTLIADGEITTIHPRVGGTGRQRPDAEAPARILLSSGSEAEPKMVAYSHNAFAGGRGNYMRAVHGTTVVPRDLVLVSLSSSYGSFGVPYTLCRAGGTLILTGRFEAGAALGLVTEHRPTHVFGVPTMWHRMAGHPADVDTSGLVAMVSSGDVLPASTLDRCRDRFGVDMISVYGSSDGVNCHTRTPEKGAGVPDPAVCDIRIVDGEIQARGPMTPLCYVNAPNLDAMYRAEDGWIRTGDHGCLDDGGALHVTGRIKRVVIRGGYTIGPAEVEHAIGGHPAIDEVACVPVPDTELGERLCACVTIRKGHEPPTLPDLTAFLAASGVATAKLPEFLLALPELPLGRTGKICHRTVTVLATRHCGQRA